MASSTPPPFKSFPKTLRNGILFLILGWVWHFFYLSQIFNINDNSRMYLQMLAIAIIMIFYVLRVKSWARTLNIVFTPAIVLIYLLILAANISRDSQSTSMYFFALLVIIFFSLSVYFLLTKETSAFFKAHNPKRQEEFSDKKDPSILPPQNGTTAKDRQKKRKAKRT
jgi:hypothetical protein